MTDRPRILIIESDYYDHITDHLRSGAMAVLDAAGARTDRVTVPGVLEIPPALAMALSGTVHYDGYVLLGCVIRGETSHYDIVANESARAVFDLATRHELALGNAILTVENEVQALDRAHPERKNKGADAAGAALALVDLRRHFGGRGR